MALVSHGHFKWFLWSITIRHLKWPHANSLNTDCNFSTQTTSRSCFQHFTLYFSQRVNRLCSVPAIMTACLNHLLGGNWNTSYSVVLVSLYSYKQAAKLNTFFSIYFIDFYSGLVMCIIISWWWSSCRHFPNKWLNVWCCIRIFASHC